VVEVSGEEEDGLGAHERQVCWQPSLVALVMTTLVDAPAVHVLAGVVVLAARHYEVVPTRKV
jgi:hypothetical protein